MRLWFDGIILTVISLPLRPRGLLNSSLVENYMVGQSENAKTEFAILKARIEHADELPLQDP